MPRYFLEVAYKGTNYAGFQVQENAVTIQGEVEKAMEIFFRKKIELTGSSRTDAGVHARQNFFHADFEMAIKEKDPVYHLNAILPGDIVIKNIQEMPAEAHCRFDAKSREYNYYIYQNKNPFISETAWHYPFPLKMELLQQAAATVQAYTDFTSFSKRNTQVKTFLCDIQKSEWRAENDLLVYNVKANRFLRGMVRGLVATMVQVGRQKITIEGLKDILEGMDNTKADFSAPGHGLFLEKVEF